MKSRAVRIIGVIATALIPVAGVTALSTGIAAAATPTYKMTASFTFTVSSHKSTATCGGSSGVTVTFSGTSSSTTRHNTTAPTPSCTTGGTLPGTTTTMSTSSGSMHVVTDGMVVTNKANRTKGKLTFAAGDVTFHVNKGSTKCAVTFPSAVVMTGSNSKSTFASGSIATTSVTVTATTTHGTPHPFCNVVRNDLHTHGKFTATVSFTPTGV